MTPRRVLLAAGAVAGAMLAATPSLAQSPCEAFAWPVAREQAAFASAGLPGVPSGGVLAAPAVDLALRDGEAVGFPLPPEKASKPGTFGGFVRASVERAGTYRVTLSDDAWIDVSQDDRSALKPVAHSGRKDCPAVRKSVRFSLNAGPVLIQVSGASARQMKLAFVAAEP